MSIPTLWLSTTRTEHLGLFNQWQNDPRVAAGWIETGTLNEHEHRTYLKNINKDHRRFSVLGFFNDTLTRRVMHHEFLDDRRPESVVGEPRLSAGTSPTAASSVSQASATFGFEPKL
ncbi:hypothetical protein FGADI_11467 [Fusarium gaditjirri]|uniref:Acyltransferase MbtK/IucB-like conserved domain-containing protein n=1 Tax=Fusarium gaditjirri TaxID=282569 RepID=A0A8H4WQ21_9HYPO|nr:hypothetical protein FGADI_11467 [Fusarium gaditjirri]